MPRMKADEIAVLKRKKKIKREELEKPLAKRVEELEERVSKLEKLLKKL